jgi:coenzyme F420-reducing hydrogenase delta subunit
MAVTEPDQGIRTSFFFCQRLDPDQDRNRRSLEMEFGPSVVFYPMPCGGRVETIHLLRALEEGADRVVVITCPRGQCRYGEGNLRAQKRLLYARSLVREIGLEPERLEIRPASLGSALRIDEIIRPILLEAWNLGPSPLRRAQRKDTGGNRR